MDEKLRTDQSRLLTGRHAQAPAVLDHSRALPQGDGRAGASRDIPVDLRPTLTIYTCWLTRTLHGGAALPVLRLAERPYKGSRWKSIPVPGPPRAIFPCNFFWRLLKMLDRCERCGAKVALVGLRHRCVPRRYGTPAVTRPTVTETKHNAKDRTAAERQRRCRRERW